MDYLGKLSKNGLFTVRLTVRFDPPPPSVKRAIVEKSTPNHPDKPLHPPPFRAMPNCPYGNNTFQKGAPLTQETSHFLYTTAIWGQKIIHLKVRRFVWQLPRDRSVYFTGWPQCCLSFLFKAVEKVWEQVHWGWPLSFFSACYLQHVTLRRT